jgi:phytoene synthase
MISGFEFDAQPSVRVQTEVEFRQYCYQVAGTVGLMMSSILGLSRSQALHSAEALGAAMQMSNIIRDWAEDEANDRCYLPRQWVESEGLWATLNRVHSWSEREYHTGLMGVSALPFRAAWAVTVAAFWYREIGRKALASGEPIRRRTVVGPVAKTWLAVRATFWLVPRMMPRLWLGWQPIPALPVFSRTPSFDRSLSK